MNLPEDCFLTYVITHEAWYYEANRGIGALQGQSIGVVAQARGGGCAWEFYVHAEPVGGGTVRLKMFADAFPALAEIPEFFAALSERQPGTLAEVREILDELGAEDATSRVNPHARRSRVGEAIDEVTSNVNDMLNLMGPPPRDGNG